MAGGPSQRPLTRRNALAGVEYSVAFASRPARWPRAVSLMAFFGAIASCDLPGGHPGEICASLFTAPGLPVSCGRGSYGSRLPALMFDVRCVASQGSVAKPVEPPQTAEDRSCDQKSWRRDRPYWPGWQTCVDGEAQKSYPSAVRVFCLQSISRIRPGEVALGRAFLFASAEASTEPGTNQISCCPC